MRIVVIGGSGLMGSKLVENLRASAEEVVAASASTAAESIDGADVVVDVTNLPSLQGNALLESSETERRDLIPGEAARRISHFVQLSVVGIERNPDIAYFRARLAQEQSVKASGAPYTIVRSTPFYEFIRHIAQRSARGETLHVSPALVQPIASDDVVAVLADVALGAPVNGTIEIAGPEQAPLDEIVREYLIAHDDRRSVIGDVHARCFGLELNDKSLAPLNGAHIGLTRFAEWLKGVQI